ncbi:DNA polymerase [Pectinatus frisingensis]|uniref:DNA polymerase n=1 Tax=Pectinatus frisingensis TaxID=865 RepID=UPI0018C55DB4|nr:DNA polymerase [Pectinatus frisingensis]
MDTLAIDIETYSDLDIKKVGGYKYAENCEILLFGFAFNDAPVKVIDLTKDKLPGELCEILNNPLVLKTAYNAQFERTVLSHYLERATFLPAAQWACTMVLSLTLGMPGSLERDSKVLNLSEDEAKLSTGKSLIQYFCKPCRPTKTNGGRVRNMPEHAPDRWRQFIEYNRRDVETERIIRKKMERFKLKKSEQKLYALDQQINDRGVKIDISLVAKAIKADTEFSKKISSEAVRISGLANPNSGEQLKRWIEKQEGFFPASITKNNIAEVKEKCRSSAVRKMLDLKMLLSKTSVKKYTAMEIARCNDGRVHGLLQFYGANRTGRWAGRLVQVQNLPRNSMPDLDDARTLLKIDGELLEMLYDNIPDVLSQLIRTAFIPKVGCTFIVADFSAIEARVIAWLANEKWRLKVFADGGDIYCASATQMFKVPVVKHGVNGELRQKGKIAELALGYQGSVGALKKMGADKMGLSDDELVEIVAKWRKASPNIVRFWYDVENAAKKAINEKMFVKLPMHHLTMRYEAGMLRIELPSGRIISYVRPRIEKNKQGRDAITYEGMEQASKNWGRLETYGGKLVENIVQATARDCLAVAMRRLDQHDFKIIMHVHDEVIIEHEDPNALKAACDIMGQPIDWAPGLLLNADGYTTNYYKKD